MDVLDFNKNKQNNWLDPNNNNTTTTTTSPRVPSHNKENPPRLIPTEADKLLKTDNPSPYSRVGGFIKSPPVQYFAGVVGGGSGMTVAVPFLLDGTLVDLGQLAFGSPVFWTGVGLGVTSLVVIGSGLYYWLSEGSQGYQPKVIVDSGFNSGNVDLETSDDDRIVFRNTHGEDSNLFSGHAALTETIRLPNSQKDIAVYGDYKPDPRKIENKKPSSVVIDLQKNEI